MLWLFWENCRPESGLSYLAGYLVGPIRGTVPADASQVISKIEESGNCKWSGKVCAVSGKAGSARPPPGGQGLSRIERRWLQEALFPGWGDSSDSPKPCPWLGVSSGHLQPAVEQTLWGDQRNVKLYSLLRSRKKRIRTGSLAPVGKSCSGIRQRMSSVCKGLRASRENPSRARPSGPVSSTRS